jgi:hypothetical protein
LYFFLGKYESVYSKLTSRGSFLQAIMPPPERITILSFLIRTSKT